MYSILVVGAGYTGARIARHFQKKKQKVHAVVRTEASRDALLRDGIPATAVDLRSGRGLEELPPAHFVVLSVAPEKGDEAGYRATYLEGVRHFLQSREGKPRPFLMVGISSTSVWPSGGGDEVDESVPAAPETEKGKILLAAERQVLESGCPSVVLRLSGIYGPGRSRLRSFLEGSWPASGPDRWMNLIHAEDVALAMQEVFNRARPGEIYAMTDDEPFLSSTLCRWLAERTGKPFDSKRYLAVPVQGRKIRNGKLRSLGISLKYPTFREGYQEILKTEYERVE